jgi:tryptophan halogenase
LLLSNLEGKPLAEPKMLSFVTGVRRSFWVKNVVAIGLSAGFLEPLESTSIHLIQQAVTHLADLLPDLDFQDADQVEYNQVMRREFESVRDFLILHYHATKRRDSEFWRYVSHMNIPQSLRQKMDLFSERGLVEGYHEGFFLEPSWLAVYFGQGLLPRLYDPLSHRVPDAKLKSALEDWRARIDQAISLNESLSTMVQMRHELVKLWDSSTSSSEQLLHDLQAWCQRAHHSGIASLEEFALRLRRYAA